MDYKKVYSMDIYQGTNHKDPSSSSQKADKGET